MFGALLTAMIAALIPALPDMVLRLVAAAGARHADAAEAVIARREARRAVLIAEQGHFITRAMRPAFAYPLAVYYAAIIVDSIWLHSGSVQALPAVIGEWSGWIISALFIADAGERISRTLARRR